MKILQKLASVIVVAAAAAVSCSHEVESVPPTITNTPEEACFALPIDASRTRIPLLTFSSFCLYLKRLWGKTNLPPIVKLHLFFIFQESCRLYDLRHYYCYLLNNHRHLSCSNYLNQTKNGYYCYPTD